MPSTICTPAAVSTHLVGRCMTHRHEKENELETSGLKDEKGTAAITLFMDCCQHMDTKKTAKRKLLDSNMQKEQRREHFWCHAVDTWTRKGQRKINFGTKKLEKNSGENTFDGLLSTHGHEKDNDKELMDSNMRKKQRWEHFWCAGHANIYI